MKDKLCLDKIITPEYITLFWGTSDAGKSYFVLYLALSMAYCIDMFIFKVNKPRKVVIFDFEIGLNNWKSRIDSLQKQYSYDKNNKNNLYIMHAATDSAYVDLDILSEKWQTRLLSLWVKNKIEVVFFDNLISFDSSIVNSPPRLNKFYSFLKKMGAQGIAVVLVHHSNKGEKDMKGSYELAAKSHNILKLEGRKQILTEPQLHDTKGAVIRIVFEKCKEAAEWGDESFTYHLPMHSGKWTALDKDNGLPSSDSSESSEGDTDLLQVADSTTSTLAENNDDSVEELQVAIDDAFNLEDLSVKAKKVYEYTKDKPTWTRKDIDDFMGWDKKTSTKYIDELITAKHIDKLGSGPSTHYRLREKINKLTK